MASIAEIEQSPREIYTGAIGYIAPNRQAQFSIAIRTSWIDRKTARATYGAGGGIVWDSIAQEEFDELQIKTRVLTNVKSVEKFALFETLCWQPERGFSLLDQHMARMGQSAAFFALAFDAKKAIKKLDRALNEKTLSQPQRVKLIYRATGELTIEYSAYAGRAARFTAAETSQDTQLVMLAKTSVFSEDPLLQHKTTDRSAYEQARSEVPQGSEPLMFNQRGEVTETDIANIVYRLNDQLYTPPLSCGLLPGTLRGQLLEQDILQERVLRIHELANITSFFLINDLRGWRKAKIQGLAD
jgi:para-aminobenzoate synthetase/4-amino-4-deoxychorismate lyase